MANDFFANIAANGIGGNMDLLVKPEPPVFDHKACELTPGGTKFETKKKMDSKEELYAELESARKYYAPYLCDLAPKIESTAKRYEIKEFIRDGKKITLPDYGGPMGYAERVYETTFELDSIKEDKCYYIRLLGADYIAYVYVNGECAGSHEGFFSPFEFDITRLVKAGENTLKITLFNDHIYMGNGERGKAKTEGDKLYAATGLGWDDPAEGWHHCPAGIGLYNKVFIEEREKIHITDLFVRPLASSGKAEIFVEVNSVDYLSHDIKFRYSVFGQNFEATIYNNEEYIPETIKTVGMGDSLTEASVKDILGHGIPMPLCHGINVYRFTVDMPDAKLWELDTPYLYQAQVSVISDGKVCDSRARQFGMRDFSQDTESEIKGMYYLNGRKIRLRGANTMGFEQQDVMRGDIDQLIDDMILAKLCNMNFLRLTQRPVQEEIYEICDRLGLMTQTDLPLFGCMRRNKFCEGVRQAEEMEKLVRSHPCNVVVTYINEPFPNANNAPHRHLSRNELERFFECCDAVIRIQNPDRVIKHVDGDYDPPTASMPDNHCYPMWYNGHGIDIGLLHRGYWLPVLPGWYYGCGEYGAEGLDFASVMRECYPSEWMAEPFDPQNIVGAQTGNFHYFFYDTQSSLEDWVRESHRHQAFATEIMTEAFRRNKNMVSSAIHLFIDAWPSGWMKTIMDCKRNPKPAFFSYRNSLEPTMLSLRTDRFTYYSGEKIAIETYICNDSRISGDNFTVRYELSCGGEIVRSAEMPAHIDECDVNYVSDAAFVADEVADRKVYTLTAILLDKNRQEITHKSLDIEIFADVEIEKNDKVVLIEKLPAGEHEIAGETVRVKACGMLPLHFASRNTGHAAVAEFKPRDFSYWYDKNADYITPILETTFEADGFTPILTSGNQDERGNWHKTLAAGAKFYDGKWYVICQADLREENPVAKRFIKNIYRAFS